MTKKQKVKKASDNYPDNWVPGWFGSRLTIRPDANSVKKSLKNRIDVASAHRKLRPEQSSQNEDAKPLR